MPRPAAGRVSRATARRRLALGIPTGGLLIVGGPPLEGKGILAARIAEWLPFAIKLDTIDNLAQDQELWYPQGPSGRAVAEPHRRMLNVARDLWRRRDPTRPPVIVLAARFGSVGARSRALATAYTAGMRLLFVEARSNQIRALRRVPMVGLTPAEVSARVARYEDILRRYEPPSAAEARHFRCLRLRSTLTNLDAALHRVLRAWATV